MEWPAEGLLDRSGFAYRYLPAYSPDLNPIEPGWAKVKAEWRRLAARTGGRLVLVSVGGIETAADVDERLRAGASLVQAYTAFIYEGPGWARRVLRGLAAARSGHESDPRQR